MTARFLLFPILVIMMMMGLATNVRAQGADTLDPVKLRTALTQQLDFYKQALMNKQSDALRERVRSFTHDESIFFFELNMKMKGMEQMAMPKVRHHFNRQPFLNMLKNAQYIDPATLNVDYKVGDIQLQYDKKTATTFIKGHADGEVAMPGGNVRFTFDTDYECRTTVSSYIPLYFRYDSMACRMNVTYGPANQKVPATEYDKSFERPTFEGQR